ncbi:MAG: hypothetical protein EBZ58_05690 [Bacteroidetes bacterium]|nr:hypothetical protein [Bacteroidota bacterium]
MALTRDQKNAIASCDYLAGLLSAETGFLSFAIAAAASTAYYLDKKASDGWSIDSPVVHPIPSTTDNTGVNHNLTCEQFFAAGNTTVTYNIIIPIACDVRPDWTAGLEAITQSYFDDIIASALAQDMSTVDEWMVATTNVIPLNSVDSETVAAAFESIQGADQDQWVENLGALIDNVSGFELSEIEKQYFVNAIQILQLSYVLWGS